MWQPVVLLSLRVSLTFFVLSSEILLRRGIASLGLGSYVVALRIILQGAFFACAQVDSLGSQRILHSSLLLQLLVQPLLVCSQRGVLVEVLAFLAIVGM